MHLINEVQCYQTVRDLRWPDGVCVVGQSLPFCVVVIADVLSAREPD